MIAKLYKTMKSDIKIYFIILGCSFLAGEGILALLMNTEENDGTVFCFGALLMFIVFVFLGMMQGVLGLGGEFNLIVGMGVTRKEFFRSYLLFTLVDMMLYMAAIYAGYFIENGIINLFFGDMEKEKGIELLLFSPYIIPVVLLVLGFGFLLGALILRYGKKMFWVFWAIWMIGSIFGVKIVQFIMHGSGAVGKEFSRIIISLGPVVHVILLIAIAAVMLYASYQMIIRQRVKENFFS